ncbi:MAG: serine hydrolase [Bacteroidota bacterium]
MLKIIKKAIRFLLYSLLALFIIGNLFIILSGRFYLYKGIANTYLVGKSGPGIYDLDIFPSRKIDKATTVDSWKEDANTLNAHQLTKSELAFINKTESSAFLVFRGDTLLFEKYYGTHKKNTVSNSFSSAKTVISMLIGIAIDEGKIKSMDEPVGNYIPEYNEGDLKKITIRHLLYMASGLDWEESGKNPLSENAESYYGSDLYGLVTRQKVVAEPGKKFIYQSGNSQLLGFVIKKATGTSVSEYCQEKLWKKIGAEHEAFWSLDTENGNEKSFCCLYATARDFGRLGKLILNFGKVANEQIVPQWYMKEMFEVPDLATEEGVKNQRYGLHAWVYDDGKSVVNYCRGIKGQYIISIPKENLVVVRLGHQRIDDLGAAPKGEMTDEYKRKIGHPGDLFDYLKIARAIANDKK